MSYSFFITMRYRTINLVKYQRLLLNFPLFKEFMSFMMDFSKTSIKIIGLLEIINF